MFRGWERMGASDPDNDGVLMGSITNSDTGSVHERCRSPSLSPKGSWGAALRRSSGRDPVRPWPSISSVEAEEEDKITDHHIQEGGGGLGHLLDNERKLGAVRALGLKPRPARTPDHLREQARYQKSLLYHGPGNNDGGRRSPLYHPVRSSVEAPPILSGPEASRRWVSIGNQDEVQEDDKKKYKNVEEHKEQRREGGGERLGPRFDQATRHNTLRALTGYDGAVPNPNNLPEAKPLLYHGPGNSNGGRRSPLRHPVRSSVEAPPILSGPEASRRWVSIGNKARGRENDKQECDNVEEHQEQKRGGGGERLGPRFEHATRIGTRRALTGYDGAVPNPDNLPEALAVIRRQDNALLKISETTRSLRQEVDVRKAESQQLRRERDSTKHKHDALRQQVDALEAESQQLRRERDSTKRKHDALDATLLSLFASVSAKATATARAHISPDVEGACANTKRRVAAVRSLLENGARRRGVRPSSREEMVLPSPVLPKTPPTPSVVASSSASKDEQGPVTKASVVIGRQGTPSTRSITPRETMAAVPVQTSAAGLDAFSTRAPEEAREVVPKKKRVSRRRSDKARHPADGSSGRVGQPAGPVTRSSARRQVPAASSRGVGRSERSVGRSSAGQRKATVTSSAGVGPSTCPVPHQSSRLQPSNISSGGGRLPTHPVHHSNSRRQPTTGASGAAEASVRPVRHTSSRRQAAVASSRGVGLSALPTNHAPARQSNGLTSSSRRFMKGTKTSEERVRRPIRTGAPRAMVF